MCEHGECRQAESCCADNERWVLQGLVMVVPRCECGGLRSGEGVPTSGRTPHVRALNPAWRAPTHRPVMPKDDLRPVGLIVLRLL